MPYYNLTSVSKVANGKATKAIRNVQGAEFKQKSRNMDDGTVTLTTNVNEVNVNLKNTNDILDKLNASTTKLFYTAIACFCGNTGNDLSISFSEKEYYRLNGWAIDPVPDENGNISEEEKNRARSALKRAKITTRNNLDILFWMTLSWKENIKNLEKNKSKMRDFYDVHLIQAKGIKNGVITIKFSEDYATYLQGLPLTSFRPEILGINAKKPNAIKIAFKLTELYYNRLAIQQGHHNKIKVSTLLDATDFPCYEKIVENKRSWNKSEWGILIPFENCMQELVDSGLLKSWSYTDKKEPESYQDWVGRTIKFELTKAPNN